MGKIFANQILEENFGIGDVPVQWYDDCVTALKEKAASGEITKDELEAIISDE